MYGTRIKTDSIETRVDNRYESIDIGGPFNQGAGALPESLRRIFVCHPEDESRISKPVNLTGFDISTTAASLATRFGDNRRARRPDGS